MARLFTLSESKYYLMALDAGTGSIRAVIFDLEGNQIAVGQAEWRHLAVPDVPGSMEFDLNKNWQLACECMRQALHNAGIAPEYIAAVSACSMREGIVLYNNEGAPIWACANVDARAAREVSELKELHNNTTIGVAGVGNLNISDGGKFVSQNITFLGDKASGIGTLNLMDATSSFDTVGINVGNFGSGIVNVSNGATLNSTGYGFI